MKTPVQRMVRVCAIVALTGLTVMAPMRLASSAKAQGPPALPANETVFASGLSNPRGLTFGPDGSLYVAEGGPPTNTMSTIGQCTQVPAAGPYTGGFTSRISKISPTGVRTTVADNLPSSQTNPGLGSLVSGVASVQFMNGTLYGLEAAAGCSHGLAGTDNTLFRVNADGTTTTVADLSAFIKAHPVANPDVSPDGGDFEPDGTWYGMVAVRGAFYATEPNHQELDRIGPDGQITRVVDLSSMFVPPDGWKGATGIAYHGNFYLGQLGTFPVAPGTEGITKVTPSGQATIAASGLTSVLGVAFDAQGRLYALETDTVAGFPSPAAVGSGQVVRVNDDGSLTTVATGLTFPTAMTFGPDGALYVSNNGFGIPVAGAGQIVRVTVAAAGAPVVGTSASGTTASFTVSFTSKAAGQGEVYFGSGQGCTGLVEVGTRDQHAGTTSHTVTVSGNDLPGTVGDNGIQPGGTYNYELVTITSSGTEVDNNGGSCYSVTIPTS